MKASEVFKFKRFSVNQAGCAMKINTDGVLLAVLAESKNPAHILDIGTGTGVIALMMAQRFPAARVHAVEIDKEAAATAGNNFRESPFASRMQVEAVSIAQFSNEWRYDLILSNPPFFVNDFRNAELKKSIARHASEDFFTDLIRKVSTLLQDDGHFWVVLPLKQAEFLRLAALDFNLFLTKCIDLHSDEAKPPFRQVLCFSKAQLPLKVEHFYIYETEKVYTNAYQRLLADFFLAY